MAEGMPRHGTPSPGAGNQTRLRDTGAGEASFTSSTHARKIQLWIHDPPSFSRHEFVMNPTCTLPDMAESELLMVMNMATYEMWEAAHAQGKETNLDLTHSLVFQPLQAVADQDVITRQHQLQLSISRSIASLCALSNRSHATIVRTPRKRHMITHMELYFKDQYMGRADMWRLSVSRIETCVYVGQCITLPTGLRAKVGRLFVHEHSVMSGYMDASTKSIFRSESARCSLFLQMSSEMWEFDESGELYYEKVLHGFLPDLLRKWKVIGTNHVVSVILFTRVLYDASECEHLAGRPVLRTASGQLYIDYYKVIVDLDSSTDWTVTMRALKEEFFRFQHDVLLQPRWAAGGSVVPAAMPRDDADGADLEDSAVGGRVLLGRIARAYEGNLLEAVNLELNSADKHYIDRDLTRTGFSIIVLTPGTGHFYADKALLRLTTQRMFDRAVSMDLVCLTQMPLHMVPVFHYESTVQREPRFSAPRSPPQVHLGQQSDPLFQDSGLVGPKRTCHSMPFWINCSFYNIEQDRLHWKSRFVPRCRMDDMRMVELLGSQPQKLALPYLSLPHVPVHSAAAAQIREQFDRDQFADARGPPSTLPSTPTPGGMAPHGSSYYSIRRSHSVESTGTDGRNDRVSTSMSQASTGDMSGASLWAPSHCSHSSSTCSAHRRQPVGGKTVPIVGETITSLLAVRSVNMRVSRSSTPHSSSDHAWHPLLRSLWPWRRPRAGTKPRSSQTTAGHAARALTAVLAQQYTPSEPTLILQHDDATIRTIATARPLTPASAWSGAGAAAAMTSADDDELPLSLPRPASTASPDAISHSRTVNPMNPRSAHLDRSAILLRWQHVFLERGTRHGIKWWSMSSPACLPLTTRYLPSDQELATSWHEYPYTVSVHSDTTSIMLKRDASSSPALMMLLEMCAQRLSQGFQLVERVVARPGAAPGTRDASHLVVRQPTELLRPGNFASGEPIYLSSMNQVHCITYKRQEGMINVTRYVQKVPYSTAPIPYRCCVWPRSQLGYRITSTQFQHPDPHAYNWTYLDSMIAGYEDTFTESLLYWRARFVLVPSEGSPNKILANAGEYLSDEEVRLAGMDRLADMFARVEYRAPGEPKSEVPLRFLPTTLDPSSSLRDDAFIHAITELYDELTKRKCSSDARSRTQRDATSCTLAQLADDMRSSSKELKIHTRLWHSELYPDAFTGADLVTWLCRTFRDIHTREDAVLLASKLQENGHIAHVLNVHGFMDGHYFYRLTGRGESAEGTTRSTRKPPTAVSGASPSARSSGKANVLHPGTRQVSSPPKPNRRRVPLSRSMLIDVDPGRRSPRSEVAVLHHDLAHNAENGFNFQIHWLGATARLIDELVQTWTRTVERYGLRLVEAPIAQIKDVGQNNPFQAPMPIALALAPPKRSAYAALLERARHAKNASMPDDHDYMETWLVRHVLSQCTSTSHTNPLFEVALLRHFGFVLDQEAKSMYPDDMDFYYSSRPNNFDYTQFVHRSGVAFVQIVGGRDGFLWYVSPLCVS